MGPHSLPIPLPAGPHKRIKRLRRCGRRSTVESQDFAESGFEQFCTGTTRRFGAFFDLLPAFAQVVVGEPEVERIAPKLFQVTLTDLG